MPTVIPSPPAVAPPVAPPVSPPPSSSPPHAAATMANSARKTHKRRLNTSTPLLGGAVASTLYPSPYYYGPRHRSGFVAGRILNLFAALHVLEIRPPHPANRRRRPPCHNPSCDWGSGHERGDADAGPVQRVDRSDGRAHRRHGRRGGRGPRSRSAQPAGIRAPPRSCPPGPRPP